MSLRRRDFLLSVTAGVAGATVPVRAKAGEMPSLGTPVVPIAAEQAAPHAETSGIEALVAPLVPGAALGAWRIERLVELEDGAASLVLLDRAGGTFQLDVCARDESEGALVPPGRSVRFDVYLANGGSGDTASFEHHGLAAMAVADVIRHNEAAFDRTGYRTLRERLSTAYDSVKRRA